MLTLPASISTNKNKIGIRPIILFDFVDLDYEIASQAFQFVASGTDGSSAGSTTFGAASATFETWEVSNGDTITIDETDFTVDSVTNETTLVCTESITPPADNLSWSLDVYDEFQDLMRKNAGVSLNLSIPELVNGLSTISILSLELTDWRNTLRSNIVGSLPDLTDSDVDVYIQLDSTDTDVDTKLKIYTGKIADYTIRHDIMTIKIKNEDPITGVYPINLLKDINSQTLASDEITKPLQYGDFMYDTDLRYYTDANRHLAICPVHLAPTDGASGTWRVYVADHKMNNVSSSTDFDQDGAIFFLYRGRELAHIEFIEGLAVSNTSTDCYIDVGMSGHKCWIFESPVSSGTDNDPSDWAEAVDGKSSTWAISSSTDNTLHVKQPDFSAYSENEPQISNQGIGNTVLVKIYAKFGAIAGDTHYLRYSKDGSTYYSIAIDEADANSWVNINAIQVVWDDLEDVSDNLQIKVDWSTAGGASIVTEQIIVGVWVQDITTSDDYFYFRCEGREFSGTWGGRRSSGNLIDNPIDMLESFFRNEFGLTNLDTDSFDIVQGVFDSPNIDVNASLYIQQSWNSLLKDICKSFNLGLSLNLIGNWRLVMPRAASYGFSSSQIGTPGNEDIFTDTDSITSNSYNQHPILKRSFKISRSSAKETYARTNLNYKRTHETFISTSTDGTGKLLTINNNYIATDVSASNMFTLTSEWLHTQKFVLLFDTFYNAIAHEIGDIINVRHDDMNDDMLDATVNTQKWMIIGIQFKWHPAIITIKAIELF